MADVPPQINIFLQIGDGLVCEQENCLFLTANKKCSFTKASIVNLSLGSVQKLRGKTRREGEFMKCPLDLTKPIK